MKLVTINLELDLAYEIRSILQDLREDMANELKGKYNMDNPSEARRYKRECQPIDEANRCLFELDKAIKLCLAELEVLDP
jgi:hypothetical protein